MGKRPVAKGSIIRTQLLPARCNVRVAAPPLLTLADGWFGGRYRHLLRLLRAQYPRVKIAITECGYDGIADGNTPDGWRRYISDPAHYARLIRGYDDVLHQDPEIIGAALFTFGAGAGWDAFDVAQVWREIARAVLRPSTPPSDGNTHTVTARVLNVRQFPWIGGAVPPVVRQARQGERVRVLASVAGWHLISADGNEWVSAQWVK